MKDFRHSGKQPPRPANHMNHAEQVQAAEAVSELPERPNAMSFAEQFIEALNEHIDARIHYSVSRRGPSAEWANADEMYKTEATLQGLLEKVRFAL